MDRDWLNGGGPVGPPAPEDAASVDKISCMQLNCAQYDLWNDFVMTGAPARPERKPMSEKDPPADGLTLADQLCFSVYATAHAFNRLYKPLLDPLGLTYPQYLVMLALWERDGRSVSSIGAALSLDSGTLTPLLKRMEAAGLVTRTRSATDERQVIVSLAPKGAALRARAVDVPKAVACAVGGSGIDAPALKAGLEAVRAGLERAARPLPATGAGDREAS